MSFERITRQIALDIIHSDVAGPTLGWVLEVAEEIEQKADRAEYGLEEGGLREAAQHLRTAAFDRWKVEG